MLYHSTVNVKRVQCFNFYYTSEGFHKSQVEMQLWRRHVYKDDFICD